jgi:galactose oxidase
VATLSRRNPCFCSVARRRARALLVSSSVLVLWVLAVTAASAARAQESQEKPFVEPSETHGKTKVPALIEAQPHLNGRWDTLPFTMPINPVHVALMHNGKVLIVSGSGNDPDNHNLQAAVWDPKTSTIKTFQIAWDMFCNGMVIPPDGKPLVLGGTLAYDNPTRGFLGEPRTAVFDPLTEKFTNTLDMSGGRWYPTGTVLGSGSVLVYSGLKDTSSTINPTVQIGTGRTWSPAGTAFAGVPLYPREHVLPDGKVFESGANRDSQLYDPAAHTFTRVATTILGSNRDYGTSVLLPLTPADGFKPKVMILGGVAPHATNTTELIDLSQPSPKWVQGPPMIKPRIQLNATILPNGKVLVSGGSENDEDNATAVKEAQLYDPAGNTFSSASAMEFPRLYHSNTLLLPDATVAALGGNPQRKVYVPEIEIYSPPYLFNPDGSLARRPAITGVTPTAIRYGARFQVSTADAADIKSVVLIRAGAVTHAFDMDQRLVGLAFTAGAGVLNATAPSNGNLAPPGYYLLFILNSKGVPSIARFVQLGAAAGASRHAKAKRG